MPDDKSHFLFCSYQLNIATTKTCQPGHDKKNILIIFFQWWFWRQGQLDVFGSCFWLLDVMLQLSWAILQDEAVKEERNHKTGTQESRVKPRERLWVFRFEVTEQQQRSWVSQATALLASKQRAVQTMLVRHETLFYYLLSSLNRKGCFGIADRCSTHRT